MLDNGLSQAILDHLPEARSDAVSREELLDLLQENGRSPSGSTLHRRLDELEKAGSVECCGEGTKGDPHRYYLPE
jgi:Fe2+ or Zn2+ uptake regulation protein